MRRNIGRHANRNARGAIRQKVRKGRRHHNGFFQSAVVIGAEIDAVFCQTFHQGFGNRGQTRFGIARGGWVIAVDIAEIALTIHQRIAHVEILRQTRHRIVNRSIAMRVIVAHHIARDLGRFAKRTGG